MDFANRRYTKFNRMFLTYYANVAAISVFLFFFVTAVRTGRRTRRAGREIPLNGNLPAPLAKSNLQKSPGTHVLRPS